MIIQSRLNLTKEGGFPPKAKPHINFKQQPRVHPKVSCLSSYLNVLIGFIGVELRSPKFNDFHPLWTEEMEELEEMRIQSGQTRGSIQGVTQRPRDTY